MPYIGNIPAEKYAAFNVQHFTTSATTSYTLDRAVANELDIRLVINNVIQQPGAGKAYTASGTTLTLSGATTGTDTMYAVYIGKAVQTVTPGANSVGPTALQDNSVTNAKLADATQGDVIYYGAAGAPAQLTAGTSGYFLKTQGAGANPIWAADNDTVTTLRPNVNPIIINGDCSVAQRSTSETGKTASGIYTVDRMPLGIDSLGTWTVAQESLTSGNAFANGFTKAFRIDCTTANASPSASNNIFFQYKLEGNSVQAFKKGTANAEKFTLSFWVKSNKTGTAQVLLQDKDNSRNVGATYSISSADTWEQKVLNFPADTTGAFTNDNAKSLEIEWSIDAGSDFTGGTLPATWTTANNNQRSVNDLALGDNTANDWAITAIQLEVGEYTSATLPPFQHESYGDNLARCYRYFQAFHPRGSGKAFGTTTAYLQVPLLKTMRSTPSYTQNAVFRITNNDTGEFTQGSTGGGFDQSDSTSGRLAGSNFTGLTDAQTIFAAPNGNVSAFFSSEL